MVSFSAITSVILHLTFIVTFLVVASLSRIFGDAKKQKPLYKLYYVAGFLMMLSMVLSMIGPELRYMEPVATALDVAGLLMGCAITYFYWDWLPKELAKG
jgi:hypothetical protein